MASEPRVVVKSQVLSGARRLINWKRRETHKSQTQEPLVTSTDKLKTHEFRR